MKKITELDGGEETEKPELTRRERFDIFSTFNICKLGT